MTTMEAEIGCATHGEPACLCDVIVTKPTNIMRYPLDHAYTDYVLRAFGDDILLDGDRLGEFLDVMIAGFDKVQEGLNSPTAGLGEVERLTHREAMLGELRDGQSIIDLGSRYGFGLEDTLWVLRGPAAKPSVLNDWSEQEWAEAETAIMEQGWTRYSLATRLNVTHSVARTLLGWYKAPADVAAAS